MTKIAFVNKRRSLFLLSRVGDSKSPCLMKEKCKASRNARRFASFNNPIPVDTNLITTFNEKNM